MSRCRICHPACRLNYEQEGFRPAIILADTKSSVVIIIPCTSNIQALRFPYTLRLLRTRENGLDADSIVLVLQLRAIDKRRLVQKIGRLGESDSNEIDKMLARLIFDR